VEGVERVGVRVHGGSPGRPVSHNIQRVRSHVELLQGGRDRSRIALPGLSGGPDDAPRALGPRRGALSSG